MSSDGLDDGPAVHPSSVPVIDLLLAAIERSGWTAALIDETPADEHHVLLTNPDGGVSHPVLLGVHDEASLIVCSSVAREPVVESAFPTAMETMTRANSGLLEGKFELDLEDGEVRFTTSAFLVAGLSVEQIEAMLGHLLAFNLAVFDIYLPSILGAVDYGEGDIELDSATFGEAPSDSGD